MNGKWKVNFWEYIIEGSNTRPSYHDFKEDAKIIKLMTFNGIRNTKPLNLHDPIAKDLTKNQAIELLKKEELRSELLGYIKKWNIKPSQNHYSNYKK